MGFRTSRLVVLAGAVLIAGCTAKPVQDVPIPRENVAPPAAAAAPATIQQQFGAPPQAQRKERIDEFYPGTRRSSVVSVSRLNGGSAKGTITLDFKETDVSRVVQAILGDLLKVNYVIDANIKGKVTLSTDRPLARDALLPTLETVLASQGAQLVLYNNVYRVTRIGEQVALSGAGISVKGDPFPSGTSYRVFPLNYISAAEMQKVVTPLLPKGAVIYANGDRNVLVIRGNAAELNLASDTVAIFDIDLMINKNVVFVGLQNADAVTVVNELEKIFGMTAKTAQVAGQVEFIPIDRLNAIMVISQQQDYIEQGREWIYRLDRNRSLTEKRWFVYYVQHGQASILAEALRGVVGDNEGDATPLPAAGLASQAQTQRPSTYKLADPTSVQISAVVGKDIRISVDKERNALLISSTPQDFQLIQDLLAVLDIQPLQVMIETSIFEVQLNDELRYGIQYAIANGGLGITDNGDATLTRGTTVATTAAGLVKPLLSPLLPGFSFTLEGSSRSRLIIDMLSDLTEVNIISSPNIIVLNNKVARIQVGDEVPIVTQTTTSAVTDNPLIVNTVQYRSTGVTLEVTPRVNASGTITMDIFQEVADVVKTTTSNIDSPTIQNRRLLSTVSVMNGATIMLGGLIREEAIVTESGIPILHDIPVIGSLFGQTLRTARRTELVVLLRPVIIATSEDAKAVTNALRRKFLTLLQKERTGIRQPRRLPEDN